MALEEHLELEFKPSIGWGLRRIKDPNHYITDIPNTQVNFNPPFRDRGCNLGSRLDSRHSHHSQSRVDSGSIRRGSLQLVYEYE